MNRKVWAALAAGLLTGGIGSVSSAHHSFAAVYDMSQPIKVTGKIAQVRMTNPHAYFFLDVPGENGAVVQWSFEAGTPSGMIRNGYSPNVIKKGDEVTISGFRARDASAHAGMLRELVTADGTVYGMFGPREGPDPR
jgi:hypothetical protein